VCRARENGAQPERDHTELDVDRLIEVFGAPRIDQRVLDVPGEVRRRVPMWLVTNGTDATEGQLRDIMSPSSQ
jgi:hypothetical protein